MGKLFGDLPYTKGLSIRRGSFSGLLQTYGISEILIGHYRSILFRQYLLNVENVSQVLYTAKIIQWSSKTSGAYKSSVLSVNKSLQRSTIDGRLSKILQKSMYRGTLYKSYLKDLLQVDDLMSPMYSRNVRGVLYK